LNLKTTRPTAGGRVLRSIRFAEHGHPAFKKSEQPSALF
jgi:hypothetical protein